MNLPANSLVFRRSPISGGVSIGGTGAKQLPVTPHVIPVTATGTAITTVSGTGSAVPGTPATNTQSTPVIASGSITGTASYSWLWLVAAAVALWMIFRK